MPVEALQFPAPLDCADQTNRTDEKIAIVTDLSFFRSMAFIAPFVSEASLPETWSPRMLFGLHFSIGTSIVAGRTWRSGQSTMRTVTLATPEPTSSGTRTGPWKVSPQQRSLSRYLRRMGGSLAAFAGYSISTSRCAAAGTSLVARGL